MSDLSPVVRLALLLIAWFVWFMAFVVRGKRHHEKAVQVDPKARWGIALSGVGYFLVFKHSPQVWSADLAWWRALAGFVFALSAIVMAWAAVGTLGSQWRVDAGLNKEHELVQAGAYRIVRHPIYASMLGMFLAAACWVGTLPGWPIGLVFIVVGTEIRVRVEDALLRDRFGERFVAWQHSVPAYLPFVR